MTQRQRIPLACGILLAWRIAGEVAGASSLPVPVAIHGALTSDQQSASIRITVANRHEGPSEPAALDVYLSADGLLDPHDAKLANRPIPPLAPRAETSIVFSAPIPGVPPGRYYVLARVRPPEDIAAPPAIRQTLWGAPLAIGPDLVVMGVEGSVETGGTLRVRGRVRNAGTRAAGPVRLGVSLSNRETAMATPLAGTAEITGLPPGESVGFELIASLADAPTGRYQLIAAVNLDRRVVESDETNNTAFAGTEYALGPDLTIQALTATLGKELAVADTVINRGTRPAESCGISFFLSRNGVLDASDVSLGYRVVPPLGPGAESHAQTTLPLPRKGLTTGRYYLLAKLDSSGAVAESDEANNLGLAATPLDLRLPQ